jgi:hypothetical protein
MEFGRPLAYEPVGKVWQIRYFVAQAFQPVVVTMMNTEFPSQAGKPVLRKSRYIQLFRQALTRVVLIHFWLKKSHSTFRVAYFLGNKAISHWV